MMMMMKIIIIIIIVVESSSTHREVTANRPDIIIKNKKRENMHTNRCGNTRGQKCCAKGSGKEVEIQEFMCNNCSHWNSNEKLKEKFGSCTGKTFDRFTTKDSYTWNITHNTESAAV